MKKLEEGMSEFASLKMENMLGGIFWEMINSFLKPPDVMVLHTSARQYKTARDGTALDSKSHSHLHALFFLGVPLACLGRARRNATDFSGKEDKPVNLPVAYFELPW